MAKYFLKTPAYIGSGMTARYLPAGVTTVLDSEDPSRTWIPLDEGAQKALKRAFGIDRELGLVEEPVIPPEAPDTMAETQLRKPKRAADRQ